MTEDPKEREAIVNEDDSISESCLLKTSTPPGNPVTKVSTCKPSESAVEITTEEVQTKQQSTKQDKVFNDEDIINHVISFVQSAVNMSRDNDFKSIAFKYSELDLILRMLQAMLERTSQFNALTNSLKARDSALSGNISVILERVSGIKEGLTQVEGYLNTTSELSTFFLPPKKIDESK